MSQKASRRVLDKVEFSAEFSKRFPDLRQLFFKLERRQSYSVVSEPYYAIWLSGKKKDAVAAWQTSEAFVREQRELVTPAISKGVRLVRVRVYQRPLSEYLKYEFETYRISSKYGQEIRCVSSKRAAAAFARTNVADYVMFDDNAAIIDNHDENGTAKGGFLVQDQDELQELRRLRDELISLSEPCEHFGID